jgi:hypothetical protein
MLLLALAGSGFCLAPAIPAEAIPVSEISFSMQPVGAISPQMYGVNYVWHIVPSDEVRQFDAAMRTVAHYTLARYPGGWAAEWYDWSENRQFRGRGQPLRPGVDASTFVSLAPEVSFVLPSSEAIRDTSEAQNLAVLAVDLVRRYGARVKLWEIGNEWWLQRGGKRHPRARRQNLAAYAVLVAAVAPAMKSVNPSIRIYATGDWTAPEEFGVLRSLVGPGWSSVDGISLHTYCGDLEPRSLCSDIPERANAIRALTGKQDVYASEWSVVPRQTADDYGIRNANRMVSAIQDLAFAHVRAAAYWPPVKVTPGIVFVSADYKQPFATGLIFGWMARYYRGEALRTDGDLPAAAAKSPEGVTLFIASMDRGHRIVRIALSGTGLTSVASAEVMFAPDPDDLDRSQIVRFVPLPTRLTHDAGGRTSIEFEFDPGTAGRGSNWEIARVTLH